MKEISINDFTEIFPYGFLGESEGEYVNRVENILGQLPPEQHSLLLDLLDLQWVSYIQQLWFISDEIGKDGDTGKIHFVLARMQINSNIRREQGLRERNMRDALMRFSYCDLLVLLETADDISKIVLAD
jgi:hypothetical protein